MPVVLAELKILVEFKEKINTNNGKKKLGDLLASVSNVVEGANPTEDIRKLREDEDVSD